MVVALIKKHKAGEYVMQTVYAGAMAEYDCLCETCYHSEKSEGM